MTYTKTIIVTGGLGFIASNYLNKNVLAFPAAKHFPRPDLPKKPLGEIYLNPEYIASHDEDLTFMLIHGFLHLLGYDHVKKNDRIRMESREKKLLRECKTILSVSTSGPAK